MLENRFKLYSACKTGIYTITIFLFFLFFNLNVHAQPGKVNSLISNGKYIEAITKLEKQLEHTKDVEQLSLIYNQIGEIQYEHLHDYRSALKTYQSILELSQEGLSKYETILSLMKTGDIYSRIGKYDKAIQTYEDLLKDYSQSGFSSRIVQRKIQNIKTALTELEAQKKIMQSTTQNSVSAQAHFQIAELLRTSLNSPEDAIARYTQLVKQYPKSSVAPEAIWRIGYVYDKILNLNDKAIEAYNKVVDNYPTSHFSPEALFRIGRIYKEKGNYAKALDAFDKLIQKSPDFWKLPAVFYWKGICLEKLKNYSQAIDAYKIFLFVYLPQLDQAHLGDIGKYQQSKLKIEIEIEGKISALQAKLSIDEQKNTQTQTPKIKWKKAQALIEKGNYSEAVPIYRKLPLITPNSNWAKKAKRQIRTVEYKSGIQQLRKTIKSLPSGDYNAMIAQERIGGIFERELKDYDKAIEEYNLVLSNYPNNSLSARVLYRIGTIYVKKTGEPDKAMKVYNQLIKEFPDSSEFSMANYQLATIYCSEGKYRKAISAYENVLSTPSRTHYIGNGYTDSFADQAQFRIGRVLYQNLQQLNSAEETFNKFVKKRPDSPRLAAAYVFLGLINNEQKKYNKAVTNLQKAIDLIIKDGSIQSEMIINEIPSISLSDKEPKTLLKYLNDKINSFRK